LIQPRPYWARRFKAPPPTGLEPGSPFGPNLRAFVLYLRFGQAITFERLDALDRPKTRLAVSPFDAPPSTASVTLERGMSLIINPDS
jgi:hypothetical protein